MALEVTEEVLRAIINLRAKNDPDFKVFMDWIRNEHNKHMRLAAFGK